jgi:hypothetical protein
MSKEQDMRGLSYALLADIGGALRANHYVGLPPELSAGTDHRVQLPVASILVLAEDMGGSIFLYRFAKDGAFAGDTWHPDIQEAMEQAAFEYNGAVGDWRAVPQSFATIEEFVQTLLV